ncbi:MAG: hypothetical protein ACXAEN_11875 [Candidatus Thorarchaeota archaeon]|jgi:hypothetical protein
MKPERAVDLIALIAVTFTAFLPMGQVVVSYHVHAYRWIHPFQMETDHVLL